MMTREVRFRCAAQLFSYSIGGDVFIICTSRQAR